MKVEIVTKEDLQEFRMQLLADIKQLLDQNPETAEPVQWLRSGETRKILKLSPASLQNLRVQGKLNPVKIGGSWYYNRDEIQALFRKNEN